MNGFPSLFVPRWLCFTITGKDGEVISSGTWSIPNAELSEQFVDRVRRRLMESNPDAWVIHMRAQSNAMVMN